MFKDRKQGKKCGRPRFKKRKKYKSYTLAGWKLLPGNRIKIGKRKYFKSRAVLGNLQSNETPLVTYIVSSRTQLDLNRHDQIAGFDFGLKRYLTGNGI